MHDPKPNIWKPRSTTRLKAALITSLGVAFMGGCSAEQSPSSDAQVVTGPSNKSQSSGFSLNATTASDIPTHIKAATFVPNLIASWFSQIIMVDIDGNLHRAVTSGFKSQAVIKGDYIDVFGFSRREAAGLFLALTRSGDIEAFVESDDDGNFKRVALSSSAKKIGRFCHDSAPLALTKGGDVFWVQGQDGTLSQLKIRVNGDSAASLETLTTAVPAKGKASETSLCAVSGGTDLTTSNISGASLHKYEEEGQDWTSLKSDAGFDGFAIMSSSPAPSYLLLNSPSGTGLDKGLFYMKDASTVPISITDGLSIKGINAPGYATVTHAKLGGALNSGALLIADPDPDNPRIVLISLEFALRTLNAQGQ